MLRVLAFLFICCAQPLCGAENPPQLEAFEEEGSPFQQVSDVRGLFFKTLYLVAGLCGLVVVGGFLLKRLGPKVGSFGNDGAITLVERKYISPKTVVWLVKVNGQPLVVVDSQNGVAIHSLTVEKP